MTRQRPSNEVTMNDDANAIPPREGIDTPFGPPPEEFSTAVQGVERRH
jgi:hypothetical protein